MANTTLHESLAMLGYRNIHFTCTQRGNLKTYIEQNSKSGRPIFKGLESYGAFSDWNNINTNGLYETIDQQYPGSKFILHTRSKEDWVQSRLKHVNRIPNLPELQAKYPDSNWYNPNFEAWSDEFDDRHKNVLEYFKDRPNDLLIIDIPSGDGWEKLCEFFNKPSPGVAFPKSNQANLKPSNAK